MPDRTGRRAIPREDNLGSRCRRELQRRQRRLDCPLDLAATEALLHGVPLTIIDTARQPLASGKTGWEAALTTLNRHRPGLVPTVTYGSGDPSTQVLALASEADLLVLGSGAPGSPDSARQGTSPATKVVRAARCPLMLVSGRGRESPYQQDDTSCDG